MKSKKGITPVIAVILLLMMTVAAAGAAFFWFIRIQGEMQGGTEQFSSSLSEKVASSMEVTHAEFDRGQNNVILVLKNNGGSSVPITNSSTAPTTTWILQDENQKIICSDDWSADDSNCNAGCGGTIAPNGIQVVNITLLEGGACDIDSETAYPNGTVVYFTIDFSGEVATGGSMEL